MVKVIIVNGAPGAGKSTFEEMCVIYAENEWENKIRVDITSTVDFVKDIAKQCGWNGTKDLKNRKFLSDLKDLLTEWDDVPFKKIEQKIKLLEIWHENWIMFVDCREPAEIQKFKDKLNALTVLIRREQVENEETSNHADAEVFNFDYDLTIWNNSDKIDLANKVVDFMKELKGEF